MKAPLPENETDRVKTLRELEILDTEAEESFDDLTRLAVHICKTPFALITLIDTDRQWFKSKTKLTVSETSRDISFCAHAILQPGPFLVPDVLDDVRFRDNPLVISEPKIRFYAGAPLTAKGFNVGTICVMDRVPRTLSLGQIGGLKTLSNQVINLIKLRRELISLNRALFVEKRKIQELETTLHKVRKLVL
jgi:GAF domain-containing protein